MRGQKGKLRIIFKKFFNFPFFHFGIISVVLFGLIIFISLIFENNINKFTFSSPHPSQLSKTGELFVGPAPIFLPEPPSFILIQENTLVAISPSVIITPRVLGALIGYDLSPEVRKEIIEHTVMPGQTLSGIAKDYNISLQTLLWANDLNKRSIIEPGQKLIILPLTGVIHHVRRGDTLEEIAKKYKADMDEIIVFNKISEQGNIFIGDILVIPGGEMPIRIIARPEQIPIADAFFIQPVTGRVSQWRHYYNAIDIANECGTPIWAAAQGVVQKTGYNRWLGKYVRILHFNEAVTVYAHLSVILVSSGQNVSQGDLIGRIGYTGHTIPAGSAGCHLHFEVRGARNPFLRN